MNKKVLTLCAGFLLAGSLTATAQVCPQNGEFPYRSRMVKSAMLDETLQNVTKINQEYYYQLQVKPESLGLSDGEFVLTAERDYSTGKIYLTAQKSNEATMTHSLWKITVKDRTVNGRVYVFVNKETGFELSFDHMNALQRDADGNITFGSETKKNANTDWKYGKDGLMDGCTYNWAWYTTDAQAGKFDYKKVYSYFHNGTDSVMALRAVLRSDGELAKMVYDTKEEERKVVDGLSVKGLDGTATSDKGFAIVAVKDSKKGAEDFINRVGNALEIRPVVAGAKVLNADEINTMIDANGSFLSFPGHIAEYMVWNNAKNPAEAGKDAKLTTKFTVCKPGTNEPMTFASNPFDNEFVAIESTVEDLRRISAGDYAGYDVLLQTKNPIQTLSGNKKQYGYLYVSEYPYEGQAFQGIYNGLEVKVAPYASLKEIKTKAKGNKIIFLSYNEATDKIDDALQARYHWKVTYYATNDSVVFEPLNASRMNQDDATGNVPFEESDLAKASSKEYLNTVNEGIAYKDGAAGPVNGNAMHNKAKGVPVALYALNFGPKAGDKANFLTVGYASGKAADGTNIDATNLRWAAANKATLVEKGNPAYVTNYSANDTYQSQMELVVRFANSYANPYERATVKDGLYFINIKNVKPAVYQTEHRTEGAYVVMDMGGHTVYDVEEAGQQDFTHMPATQWVVEQDQCLDTTDDLNVNRYPTVVVRNREFADVAFAGQLYKNKETGNLVTLNHRKYIRNEYATSVKNHYRTELNCADEFVFNKIEKPTKFGYFNEAEETLRNSVYKFQHMFDMSQNLFLGTDGKFVKLTKDGAEFELYRAEGWTPVQDYHYEYNYATGKEDILVWDDTYHFVYADSAKYGYTSERAGAEQLYKTFYKVKVKDENLIDNDHTFLAINNQYKYVIATEKEILDSKNELRFAVVTLKENNHLGIEHGYSLVNAPEYTIVKAGATKDDLKDLKWELVYDETDAQEYTSFYYVDSKGKHVEMVRLANHFEDENKNWHANWGKLAVESISLNAKIASLCETTTDAFALLPVARKLYRTLDAAVVNNAKKVIDLTTIDEQGNESLFEDSGSKLAKANKLNYLAAENLGNQTKREGFYVDKVAKSSAYMPQYLLAVAADSVPAYKYCVDGIHGINPGCGHEVETPGYVEGRFLVNFNDSIKNALIDKLTKRADAFKYYNFVRLGFVEGIHRGDSLYILKDTTLASIKKADKNGKLYVDPMFFNKANEGKKYNVVKLDGKHNNAAFSFRETGDADNSFLIESNDIYNDAMIGSFGAGAWIEVRSNVPVLTQYWNVNGNHNTGDSTDAWKKFADATTTATFGQAINQATRFTMKAVDKDAHATANETIATSDVTVSATNGAVVVKGAAGKAVVVTNILGQTLANTVISSDNASISVPAGIVVVAVEGEEAVKVVVK